VAWSPDGSAVVAAPRQRGIVRQWDLADNGPLARPDLANALLDDADIAVVRADKTVATSPDGRTVAIARADGTVQVQDATTGELMSALEGHIGPVLCAAYSLDGKRLASGSEDTTIRIWDSHTGKPMLELRGHAGPVSDLAFGPDGARLLSGSTDATVRLWDARPFPASKGRTTPRVVKALSNSAHPRAATPTSTALPGFTETIVATRARFARCVAAADLDGDGDIDLLSASQLDSKLAWYEQTARGFEEHAISLTARGARRIRTADLDGDGDLDLMSTSSDDGNIAWYENRGGPPPAFIEHVVSTSVSHPWDVQAADIDADGCLDLLSVSQHDHTVAWWRSDGQTPPAFTKQIISSVCMGASAVFPADVDGDGDLDVLSGSRVDDTLRWHQSDGGATPSFIDHVIYTGVDTDDIRTMVADDIDGDGDLDLIVAPYSSDRLAWWENDGETPPRFVEHVVLSGVAAEGSSSVTTVDFDGDGDIDILAGFEKVDKVSWFENDGAQMPAFTEHTVTRHRWRPAWVVAADVDGDGVLDVVIASADDNTIAWYRRATLETPYRRELLR
jgi:WD40 repeat protein